MLDYQKLPMGRIRSHRFPLEQLRDGQTSDLGCSVLLESPVCSCHPRPENAGPFGKVTKPVQQTDRMT